MIRVLVADDHPIVREGLRVVLSRAADRRVEAEAANGLEAYNMARTGRYDVLLLDISISGRNSGLDLVKELKRSGTTVPILIFTMHPEEQYGVYALKAGAAGYLKKGAATDEVVKAIRKVAAGGRYVSAALAEVLAGRLMNGHSEQASHNALSQREFEVLVSLASGKPATEIARGLMLSVKTISTYRTRILEKLQLKDTAHLIRYAVQNGLVSGSEGG